MRCSIGFMFAACLLFADAPFAQDRGDGATADLERLLGDWTVEWTYSPDTDEERRVNGSLSCNYALNNQHIFCRYHFERESLPAIIEHVYFNHNAVYAQYEAIWVSGTWPIKVLMAGNFGEEGKADMLTMQSEFSIGNGIVEKVRSEMDFSETGRLTRRTFLHLSDAPGVWKHHMTEQAVRDD